MEALQASPLPESAEILDILNRIEFEGLFFSHDKLAERQVGCTTFRHLYFFWPKPGLFYLLIIGFICHLCNKNYQQLIASYMN